MKLFLIHLLSGIGRLLLRLRGVRTGTGIILSGFPLIKKFPGASITIGNGVTIHSLTRMNPVLSHHTCLSALSNQASCTIPGAAPGGDQPWGNPNRDNPFPSGKDASSAPGPPS